MEDFHSPGPAAENALSPKVLHALVTAHVRLTVGRSRRSRASATRRQSSATYDGEMQDASSDLYTIGLHRGHRQVCDQGM